MAGLRECTKSSLPLWGISFSWKLICNWMLGFEMVEQITSSPTIRQTHPFTQLADRLLELFVIDTTSVSSKNSHTGLVRFLVDILLISLTNCAYTVSRGRIQCHLGIWILNFYVDIQTYRIFVAALVQYYINMAPLPYRLCI